MSPPSSPSNGDTGDTTPIISTPTSPPKKKDDIDVTTIPCMEDNASWFSYIFMTYLDKIFAIGYQRTLEMSDLGGVSKTDRCDILYARYEKEFPLELAKPSHKRSLMSVLWKIVGYSKLSASVILFFISSACQLGPVMVLNRLTRYFQGQENYNEIDLWILASLLLVFPFISALTLAHSTAIALHLCAQVRNILTIVIYRKSLRISPYHRQTISTGRIITMFSEDTNQIRNFLLFINFSICAPFQVASYLYLVYQQVGVSTFVGLGFTIAVTPIIGLSFNLMSGLQKKKNVIY